MTSYPRLSAAVAVLYFAAGFFSSANVYAAGDAAWFAAAKVSLGDVTIDGVGHGGTIGTGALINGQLDGRLEDTETDDYTAGVAFAVGRRMGNWQVEAEYTWRYRTDWDVVATTDSIQAITNVFSNVETGSLMLNLARRGVISENWSWEIGAGAGLVYNSVEATYIERAVPGMRDEMRFKDDGTESSFSYNAFVGVTRALSGPWTLNIRYRYIDLGDLEAGPFPQRPARLSADHTSNELQFSLERDL